MARTSFFLVSLVLAAAVALAGCTDPSIEVRERLHGDWRLDLSGVPAQVPESAPPEHHAYANMLVNDFSMVLSFRPEGRAAMRTTVRGRDRDQSGTWELLAWDGDNMVVQTTFGNQTDELQIGLAGRRMVLSDGPQTMVFQRR